MKINAQQSNIALSRFPSATPTYDLLSLITHGVQSNDEALLLNHSNSQDMSVQSFAESMLAAHFDYDYIRGVNASASSNKNSSGMDRNNWLRIDNEMYLQLYPNPSKDYLKISFSDKLNDVKASLHLYDATGKEVYQSMLSQYNELAITNLQTGTYFCKISIGGVTKHTQKLMIIK